MIIAATPKAPSIAQKVLRIIRKIKSVNPARLRFSANLDKELGLDNFDVVRIIWELEKSFKINIPDEVPLNTVGDFVEYVSSQTERRA